MMKKCKVCGKQFDVLYPELWRYKIHSGLYVSAWFCSWKCLRAKEKGKEENRMGKISDAQKEKAIQIAIENGDPIAYLKECGSEAPAVMWYSIKKRLKKEDTELAIETIAENVGKEEEDIFAFGFYWQGIGYTYNEPGHLWTAVWNKCWRRKFIERIGARFPDWVHSDDEGFSRITHRQAKIACFHEALYYYNFMRPGSLTWQIENGMLDRTIPAE